MRALVLTLLIASAALAAPAPFARPVKPIDRRELVGAWRMTWAEAHYDLMLAPDGGYRAESRWGWAGAWGLADGKLWVQERPESSPDAEPVLYFFAVRRVGGGFAGRTAGAHPVRIRLARPALLPASAAASEARNR